MTKWPVVKLVASREISARGKDKSFIISTAITLAILVGVILLNVATSGEDSFTVGYVGDEALPIAEFVKSTSDRFNTEVTIDSLSDEDEAREALEDGGVDGVVTSDSLLFNEEAPPRLEQLAQSAYADSQVQEELRAQGLSDEEIASALSPEPLEVELLNPPDPDQAQNSAIAFVGVLLLYGQLFGYGFWVASGVVEEKATRVVELLLSTIRPRELLAGKIIGIGVVGFVQLVVIAGVGLAAGLLTGLIDLPGSAIATVLNVLLWFVIGFAFYSCLFAVAGALAARQEDLQSTTGPLSMLILGSFFAAIFTGQNPDALIGQVATFLPFSAPMIVPLRMAVTDLALWQVVLSFLMEIVSIVVLVRIAGRLYSGAILRTGGTVKLKEAWASATS